MTSMTAYARGATQQDWGRAEWELRSINHRYLDLSFKMPDNFRYWEMSWRNLVSQMIHRGKVECHLSFHGNDQTTPLLKVNTSLVEQLLASCQVVSKHKEVSPTVDAMRIIQWPNVLLSEERDLSKLKNPLTDLLQQTLMDLIETRKREGNQQYDFLKEKIKQIQAQVAVVKEVIPRSVLAQKQKMEQKIKELSVAVDPQRLEQEMVYYAQRMDISEEIERLLTHTIEVEHTLEKGGPMGRRLDFLMQELNREANTLTSKSQDTLITQVGVELKVIIEQMREQIQNIE